MGDYFLNTPSNILEENQTTETLRSSDSIRVHSSLPAYKSTPLIKLKGLANKYGLENIWIKDESKRFGLNSFKSLGVSYVLDSLNIEGSSFTVLCTATDGNHGKALAWAAKIHDKQCFVFVPGDTSENRINEIRKEGAEVIQTDGNYDQACKLAEKESNKNAWTLVQDTAWDNYETIPALIMSGYLSMFKELEDTLHTPGKSKIDIVFLQAGVGSFAAAASWYYLNRYKQSRPQLVIVEPEQADGIMSSFKAGKLISSSGSFSTIMAGLNCGLPSSTGWSLIKSGVDAAISINDKDAMIAMRELYYPSPGDLRIIAGESGAAGLAGFIALMTQEKYFPLRRSLAISKKSNILFINTEGDTDKDLYQKIIKIHK